MTDEAAPSPQTSAALNDLYAVYAHLDEVAGVNQEQYGESLRLLVDVSADRRAWNLASHSGLPDVLWVVLVGGGASGLFCLSLRGGESPVPSGDRGRAGSTGFDVAVRGGRHAAPVQG